MVWNKIVFIWIPGVLKLREITENYYLSSKISTWITPQVKTKFALHLRYILEPGAWDSTPHAGTFYLYYRDRHYKVGRNPAEPSGNKRPPAGFRHGRGGQYKLELNSHKETLVTSSLIVVLLGSGDGVYVCRFVAFVRCAVWRFQHSSQVITANRLEHLRPLVLCAIIVGNLA